MKKVILKTCLIAVTAFLGMSATASPVMTSSCTIKYNDPRLSKDQPGEQGIELRLGDEAIDEQTVALDGGGSYVTFSDLSNALYLKTKYSVLDRIRGRGRIEAGNGLKFEIRMGNKTISGNMVPTSLNDFSFYNDEDGNYGINIRCEPAQSL